MKQLIFILGIIFSLFFCVTTTARDAGQQAKPPPVMAESIKKEVEEQMRLREKDNAISLKMDLFDKRLDLLKDALQTAQKSIDWWAAIISVLAGAVGIIVPILTVRRLESENRAALKENQNLLSGAVRKLETENKELLEKNDTLLKNTIQKLETDNVNLLTKNEAHLQETVQRIESANKIALDKNLAVLNDSQLLYENSQQLLAKTDDLVKEHNETLVEGKAILAEMKELLDRTRDDAAQHKSLIDSLKFDQESIDTRDSSSTDTATIEELRIKGRQQAAEDVFQSPESTATEKLLAQGILAEDEKRWDDALVIWRVLEKIDPTTPQSNRIGWALGASARNDLKKGEKDLAIAKLKEAVSVLEPLLERDTFSNFVMAATSSTLADAIDEEDKDSKRYYRLKSTEAYERFILSKPRDLSLRYMVFDQYIKLARSAKDINERNSFFEAADKHITEASRFSKGQSTLVRRGRLLVLIQQKSSPRRPEEEVANQVTEIVDNILASDDLNQFGLFHSEQLLLRLIRITSDRNTKQTMLNKALQINDMSKEMYPDDPNLIKNRPEIEEGLRQL